MNWSGVSFLLELLDWERNLGMADVVFGKQVSLDSVLNQIFSEVDAKKWYKIGQQFLTQL